MRAVHAFTALLVDQRRHNPRSVFGWVVSTLMPRVHVIIDAIARENPVASIVFGNECQGAGHLGRGPCEAGRRTFFRSGGQVGRNNFGRIPFIWRRWRDGLDSTLLQAVFGEACFFLEVRQVARNRCAATVSKDIAVLKKKTFGRMDVQLVTIVNGLEALSRPVSGRYGEGCSGLIS